MTVLSVDPRPSVPREPHARTLLLWCDGAHDAAENMRRDAALLARLEGETGDRTPVLRLFRFAPPGITLGRGQDPARELDLARCRADGIGWAIRPTGGRAILHAEEWTFSLAATLDDPEWGGSLADAYARVSRLIAASLVRLGVPAELAARRPVSASLPNAEPHHGGFARVSHGSTACFAATARHEIVLGGRKLVGSAQRRTRTALLQQGSVLLGDGHLRLADYVAATRERRDALRAALRTSTATAGEALGGDLRLERWATALAAELGSRAHRRDGAAGVELLTPEKGRSYTSPVSRPSMRPGTTGGSHNVR